MQLTSCTCLSRVAMMKGLWSVVFLLHVFGCSSIVGIYNASGSKISESSFFCKAGPEDEYYISCTVSPQQLYAVPCMVEVQQQPNCNVTCGMGGVSSINCTLTTNSSKIEECNKTTSSGESVNVATESISMSTLLLTVTTTHFPQSSTCVSTGTTSLAPLLPFDQTIVEYAALIGIISTLLLFFAVISLITILISMKVNIMKKGAQSRPDAYPLSMEDPNACEGTATEVSNGGYGQRVAQSEYSEPLELSRRPSVRPPKAEKAEVVNNYYKAQLSSEYSTPFGTIPSQDLETNENTETVNYDSVTGKGLEICWKENNLPDKEGHSNSDTEMELGMVSTRKKMGPLRLDYDDVVTIPRTGSEVVRSKINRELDLTSSQPVELSEYSSLQHAHHSDVPKIPDGSTNERNMYSQLSGTHGRFRVMDDGQEGATENSKPPYYDTVCN